MKWVQRGSLWITAHTILRSWHLHHLLSYQDHWTYSLHFFFLFMKEFKCFLHIISVILQALVYETSAFILPSYNEEGNEMAFQESMEENPLVLSSGNSWTSDCYQRTFSRVPSHAGLLTSPSSTPTTRCTSLKDFIDVSHRPFPTWQVRHMNTVIRISLTSHPNSTGSAATPVSTVRDSLQQNHSECWTLMSLISSPSKTMLDPT